jgi:hypothetical protein
MASSFNLTAQINLRGPTNLKPIVADIKRQLGSVTTNVNIKLDNRSGRSIDTVTNRLKAMNDILIKVNANARDLNSTFSSLSSSLSSIQRSSGSVSSSVGKVSSNMQQTAKNIKVARTEIEEFGRQSFLAIKRFGAFTIVTTGIFALTNAITSGFKAFIQFDRELVKLQQVTGKGSLGIKELEKQITNLATTLGVSSESLTSVASTLAQAGLSAEDTRIALAALAKTELAPSFDNLTDTTEGAIAALRQFELQAGDLESALGSINAVAAAFAVESKDIISAIQRTGGVFASASKGVSEGTDALNEFIAIFTSVRQTTRESAETIATGLRTIFTRVQRSSTINLLKQYGVELRDLEGKFVGPFEAVKRLSGALNQLDPRSASFAKIVEELGGFRQIGKVIPLIQQFATAQQALAVAQKGQSSLTDAQVIAQKSLANQIAKVREQFLALIRDIGQSSVFQGLFKIVTGLTSGLISLASAFKPILPILGIIGAIKGVSAIGQFATGFFGGLKKGGGSRAAGENIGGSLTGNADKERQTATSRAVESIRLNTDALKGLTSAVTNLEQTIRSRGPSTLNNGGKVMGFARGGVVPGTGNQDTVPALLMPGEFVIRKKAVAKLGANNLHKMNKYADGGLIKQSKVGFAILKSSLSDADEISISPDDIINSSSEEYKSKIKDVLEQRQNKSYILIRQGLAKAVREQFNNAIDKGLVNGVNTTIKNLSSEGGPFTSLPVPAIKGSSVQKFLSGINTGAKGAFFEEILTSMSNKGVYTDNPDPNRPFDFISGLGDATNVFKALTGIDYIDAKSSTAQAQPTGKGGMAGKIANQLLREVSGVNIGSKSNRTLQSENAPSDLQSSLKDLLQKIDSAQISGGAAGYVGLDGYDNFVKQYTTMGLKKQSIPTAFKRLPTNESKKQFLRSLDDLVTKAIAKKQGTIIEKSLGGSIEEFANGGSAQDTIPALLTPGEFVINRKAAKHIGYSRLNKLNKADKLQGYNRGGIVGGIQKFAAGGSPDDEAFLDYKARKEGTNLKDYLYSLSQKLGRTAYETTEMYPGRVQEMKYELAGKRDTLGNIGSTIRQAQTDMKSTDPAIQAGAAQRLADAQSRLAIESENIAKEMLALNPTLDMNMVEQASKEVADLLSNGDLVKAQEKLVATLGKAPDSVEAMNIAMERVAKEVGIDAGLLQREFGAGGGSANRLKQQQFIQSREGQRFGRLAEFAPGFTERVSKTGVGQGLGSAADFISGKGGGLSRLFAGVGGISGIGGAVAVGAETLKNYLPKSVTSNPNTAGALGALSGAGSGAASGALLGSFAGPIGTLIGGVGGAIIGGLKGYFSAKNTQILTNALDNVSASASKLDNAFKVLEKDSSDVNYDAAQKAFGNFLTTSNEISKIALTPENTNPLNLAAYSSEQRSEAVGAMIQNSQSNIQSASLLAQQEANRTSTEDLAKSLKQLENNTSIVLPTVKAYQDASIKAAEEANGATVNLTQSEKDKIKADAEATAALDAYTAQRKQSGATEAQLQKELSDPTKFQAAIAQGRELARQNDILARKQQLLSRAMKDVQIIGESLTNVFNRITAGLTRFSQEIDKTITSIDSRINDISGNATIGKVDRTNEEIFNNIAGYSMQEVQDAAANLNSRLGGGPDADKLTKTILASKTVNEQLPELLRTTKKEDIGGIVNVLEQSVQGITGGAIPDSIAEALNQVRNKIESKTDEGQGNISGEELAADTGFLDKVTEILNQGVQQAANLEKARNDALDKSIDLQNKWIDVMETSAEYARKAAQVNLESSLEFKKAIGQSVSLNELNAPFDRSITDLTGGASTAQQISDNIRRLQQQIGDQNQGTGLEGERKRILAQAGGENTPEFKANETALKNNRRELNNNINALKKLADSTDKASNALGKIQEERGRGQSFIDLIQNLVTGGAQNRAESIMRMNAFTAGQQALGTGNLDFFGNEFNVTKFFEGFNDLKGALLPERAAEIQAGALKAILQQNGVDLQANQPGFETNFGQGVNNFEKLINRIVKMQEPAENPLVKAYKDAAAQQEEANKRLEKINKDLADNIQSGSTNLLKNLGEALPNIVKDAFVQARADIAAAVQAAAPPVVPAPRKANGGMIDSASIGSKGQLVHMKPQGTDKYPYMLSKGEAVINAATTKKNPGIIGALLKNQVLEPEYAATGVAVGFEPDTTIESDRQKLREEVQAQGAAYAAGTSEEYKKDKAELDSLQASYDETKIRRFFFDNPQYTFDEMAEAYATSPYGANIPNWINLAKEQKEQILAGYRAKFNQFHDELMAEAKKDPLLGNRFGPVASWPEWEKMREEARNQNMETLRRLQDQENSMHWKGLEDTRWNNETKQYDKLGTYSMRPLSAEQKAREDEINRRSQLEYDRQIITGEKEAVADKKIIMGAKGPEIVDWANPGEKAAAAATRRAKALDNVNRERAAKGLPPLELPPDQIDPKLASDKALHQQKLAENREKYKQRQEQEKAARAGTSQPQTGSLTRAQQVAADKQARANAYKAEKDRRKAAYNASRKSSAPAQRSAGRVRLGAGIAGANNDKWADIDNPQNRAAAAVRNQERNRQILLKRGEELDRQNADESSLSSYDKDALFEYQQEKMFAEGRKKDAERETRLAETKAKNDAAIAKSKAKVQETQSVAAQANKQYEDRKAAQEKEKSDWLAKAKADQAARLAKDTAAQQMTNPLTGKPYRDAAEKAGVDARMAYEQKRKQDAQKSQLALEEKRKRDREINGPLYTEKAKQIFKDTANLDWMENNPELNSQIVAAIEAKYGSGQQQPTTDQITSIARDISLQDANVRVQKQSIAINKQRGAAEAAGAFYSNILPAMGNTVVGQVGQGAGELAYGAIGTGVGGLLSLGSALTELAIGSGGDFTESVLKGTAAYGGTAETGGRRIFNALFNRQGAEIAGMAGNVAQNVENRNARLLSNRRDVAQELSARAVQTGRTEDALISAIVSGADTAGEMAISAALPSSSQMVRGATSRIGTAFRNSDIAAENSYQAWLRSQKKPNPNLPDDSYYKTAQENMKRAEAEAAATTLKEDRIASSLLEQSEDVTVPSQAQQASAVKVSSQPQPVISAATPRSTAKPKAFDRPLVKNYDTEVPGGVGRYDPIEGLQDVAPTLRPKPVTKPETSVLERIGSLGGLMPTIGPGSLLKGAISPFRTVPAKFIGTAFRNVFGETISAINSLGKTDITKIPQRIFGGTKAPAKSSVVKPRVKSPDAPTPKVSLSQIAPKIKARKLPNITHVTDPKQASMGREDLAQFMAEFTSSPEAKQKFLKESQSLLTPKGGVVVDPQSILKEKLRAGRSPTVGPNSGMYTKQNSRMTVGSEGIDPAVFYHETGHVFQHNTGKGSLLMNKDIKRFLNDPEGFQKLTKGREGLYTAADIEKDPNELLTTLLQLGHTENFAKNKKAQDMLRTMMKFHGYSKGGMVTRNNGIHMPWLNNGDNMLATLRTGEGVVNAPAYAKYGTLVDAINRSKGGPLSVPGFAEGTNNGGGSAGPLGSNYSVGLNSESQRFMDTFAIALNNFGSSFSSYVDKLNNITFPNIPDKIELTGNYQLQVNITGAAALESLDKRMQELAVSLIEPKINELRDEVSAATNNSVKSSASRGKTNK